MAKEVRQHVQRRPDDQKSTCHKPVQDLWLRYGFLAYRLLERDNSQTAFCPGGSGQYVYLQVFYAMPLLGAIWLPAVTATFNGQTVKLVSAAAAFKNEPYQSTYTPPAGC